jgi:hypothetical protein
MRGQMFGEMRSASARPNGNPIYRDLGDMKTCVFGVGAIGVPGRLDENPACARSLCLDL